MPHRNVYEEFVIFCKGATIGDTLVIAKRPPVNQQVEMSLVPIALFPAGLDPVKPQVLQPRLALPKLIRCQTSPNSLIYVANFGNYVRGTNPFYKILLRLVSQPQEVLTIECEGIE